MDYKKKYEQALENIKKIKAANKDNKELLDFIEYQYPELKESEDERIRKEIIQSIQDNMCVIHKDKCLAWLEKQGEQKTNDKIEPKFKVGDWVSINQELRFASPLRIKDIDTNNYRVESINANSGAPTIDYLDNHYHLWTIQDAKDGDMLAKGDMVLIFKCFEEPSYRQHIIAHIGLDTCGHIQITNDSWNLGLDGAYPATKEQRNLLFQKIKESGYLWDAEKKKLKKIEQKPAWSEEDENILNDCIKLVTECSKSSAQEQGIIDWLKSLKERMKGE